MYNFHIKEILIFNSRMKLFNLKAYKIGSSVIQNKVSCPSFYLFSREPESTVLKMFTVPGIK